MALSNAGPKHDKTYYKALITAEAIHQGFDPKLAIAVATVESGLNPNAVGQRGETGLFQLMPRVSSAYAKVNIHQHIKEAIIQLRKWQAVCPTKEQQTFVICYNAGFRNPKYPLLNAYYRRVMGAM